jgi:hypothetical protein
MQAKELIDALFTLIKADNEKTEDVFYNAGVIDAIQKVKNLEALQQAKGESPNS